MKSLIKDGEVSRAYKTIVNSTSIISTMNTTSKGNIISKLNNLYPRRHRMVETLNTTNNGEKVEVNTDELVKFIRNIFYKRRSKV